MARATSLGSVGMALKNSTFVNAGLVSGHGKVAQQAWDEGGSYFTPVIESNNKSGAVFDWPASIAAIESVGWKLHTWTAAVGERGIPVAMPLFVRP